MTSQAIPRDPVTALHVRRRVSVTRRSARAGWVFVAPFLVVLSVAVIAPVVYAIYLSLFRDRFIGGEQFVGLANYVQAFTDAKLWSGVLRVLLFFAIQVPIMLAFALVAALALDSGRLRWSGAFRIILFLPYAVPGVVSVLIWAFVYGPQFGLVGTVNSALGGAYITPLTPQAILGSIANIAVWEYAGYYMLVFYATLRTVSGDIYEAAEIDGAGPLRTVISIKLPALRGAIVIAVVFSVIGSFQLFNEPNLLRTSAPTTITSNFTPTLYTYTLSFAGQQYNYAAALAVVLGLVTGVVAYIVQVRGNRSELR
jgi:multiple sugar transport system permease protein